MANGYITDERVAKRLSLAADVIEATSCNVMLPVIIGDDGISILGDQCRFYAKPARDRSQLGYLRDKYGMPKEWTYETGSAFRNLSKLDREASNEIKGALCLPSNAGFSVSIGNGFVVFDFSLSALVGKDTFYQLHISDMAMPERNAIPLGRTLESETVIYCPEDARHAHVLIAGQTGSGKTVIANTIIAGLVRAYTPDEMRLLISSGKPEDVQLWEGLPHLLAEPTYNPQETFGMLAWLEGQRRERAKQQDKGPMIIAYLGEVSILVELNPRKFSDLLESLVRLGRSERIGLICATQRPRGDQVGTVVARSQFGLVLCGRMANPQDGYLALGQGKSGSEYLPGRGAFITNNLVRFQAAFAADANNPRIAQEVVNVLRRQYPEPDYIDLPDIDIYDTSVSAKDSDMFDVEEWLRDEKIDTLSITALQAQFQWGFPRAKRVFTDLQRAGVIGTERDGQQLVQVLLEENNGD